MDILLIEVNLEHVLFLCHKKKLKLCLVLMCFFDFLADSF